MSDLHEIDPTQKTVEFEGRTFRLSSLAEIFDEARERHVLNQTYPFRAVEITESRGNGGGFNIRGHAAVFNQTSHDLGGFREQVMPGFFQPVLDRKPDVHAVWDHDTRLTLGRTKNSTLELREDDLGLYNYIKVAPTSYSNDLRILMDRGDIDQQSFAFTVEDDRFEEDDAGNILRSLVQARELFDVTVTAQGAYPQTTADVSRSIRSLGDLDRKFFAVSKVSDGAADKATAVAEPADVAAPEGQAVSGIEDDEDFAMWHAAMEKKAAAVKATLAKSDERLGILNERENAGGASV